MLEISRWLQDIGEHFRVTRQRAALRQPGQGFDYTQDEPVVQQVVARLHPRRMRLRVVEILPETPTTKTLRFARADGPLPPFRAGQYINVFVDVDGVRTSRPYSIASPPGSPLLDLTVRDKPGGLVAPYLLHEVQVGDELETTGPAGSFYHESLIDGTDLVCLAGGSGITPFMSLTRTAVQHDHPLHIQLLYGSRVPDDVIYADELATLAALSLCPGHLRATAGLRWPYRFPRCRYHPGAGDPFDGPVARGGIGDPLLTVKANDTAPGAQPQRAAPDQRPGQTCGWHWYTRSSPGIAGWPAEEPVWGPAPAVNRPGFAHLAFAVGDVAAARDAVLAAGGRAVGELVTVTIPGVGPITFAYVTDPEGNVIELQRWSD